MDNFKAGIRTVKPNGYVRTMDAVMNFAMVNACAEGLPHSVLNLCGVKGQRATIGASGYVTRIGGNN